MANALESLPIHFHPATCELADLAATYKTTSRLGLADAFAAVLAKKTEAELVTGDPEFKPLETEIRIT